jgi:3-dehydroquinate synthase
MTAPDAVRVELGERSYDVLVGAGAAAAVAAAAAGAGGKVALLADERVAGLHAAEVAALAERAGRRVEILPLPEGEAAKTLAVVEDTCRRLVGLGFERGDVVLALGGGATTDAAGFVAAVYLRGVRAYLLPTTLLGQVDAAVGGKTGVDLPEGKNLVGAFAQPALVGCDPRFLATLPGAELRAGLAEVVKAAWIGDPELLGVLQRDPPRDPAHPGLSAIVRRAVGVKARVVARDEREAGERAVLNFGHTIGHALETESKRRRRHGECVALGLVAAVHLSVAAGWCGEDSLARMLAVLEAIGLPTRAPDVDADAVLARARVDKKRRDGRARWLLTRGPGSVSVAAGVPEGAPRAAVDFLRR